MGIKMVKLRAVLAGAGLVLGLAILSMASPAAAQNATVVSACGTPPATYPVGANRAVTQDTNGNTCTNTTSGGGVAPAPYKPTIVPLDVATVTTGGTAVTALTANHRTAGGAISNPTTATPPASPGQQGGQLRHGAHARQLAPAHRAVHG